MKTTHSSCEPTTFLRSLDLDSPLAAAAQILEQFSPLFAATVGLDIRPIERAAAFETWDEREHYTGLAASLIGNAVIDKPEDLTYWLNLETLADLLSRRG